MIPDAPAGFNAPVEFEQFLCGRLPKLVRVAFRYLDNPEDAQDAVQDALLSAFRHASEFQQRAQLSTWLHRIVVNAALMKLRARRRRETVSLDETTGEDEEPLASKLASSGLSPEQLCEQTELRQILLLMAQRLPPKQRRAFLLCAVEGRSLRDAAQSMGVAESALKCSLVRARRNLRKPLRQQLHFRPPLSGIARSAHRDRSTGGRARATAARQGVHRESGAGFASQRGQETAEIVSARFPTVHPSREAA